MNRPKEKLYRKENKVSLYHRYYVSTGSDFRYTRNTKEFKNFEGSRMGMKKGKYGRDYTPLYMFLHSKEGKRFDDVYSEAVSRLDGDEFAVWHIVRNLEDLLSSTRKEFGEYAPVVRCGQNAQYSSMYVDESGILRFVDKFAKPWPPSCTCCTHSFNGKAIEVNKRPKVTINLSLPDNELVRAYGVKFEEVKEDYFQRGVVEKNSYLHIKISYHDGFQEGKMYFDYDLRDGEEKIRNDFERRLVNKLELLEDKKREMYEKV